MYVLNKLVFKKNLKGVGSWHVYPSFGTFKVKIGPFFDAQWVIEKCLKKVKSLFLKENDVYFKFVWKFEITLCIKFECVKVQNYFVIHEQFAVKNLFSTCIWNKVFVWQCQLQIRIASNKTRYYLYTINMIYLYIPALSALIMASLTSGFAFL